jgi:Big-like domain-containing protein
MVVDGNRHWNLVLMGLLLFAAACGGENLTLPSEGEPAQIEIVEWVAQEGPVKSELPPLTVRVTDTQDRPVQGATVEFVLQDQDDDDDGATVNPPTGVTDANGQTSASIRLGTRVGPVTGEARVPVEEGREPVATQFQAMAYSANANALSMAEP